MSGSSPGWVTNYVPLATEWNANWAAKADWATLAAGSVNARSLPSRFSDVINVLDWITSGQPDGTTDNTAQLQAAINAGVGKVVYFPATTNNYNLLCVNTVLDGVNGRAALTIPSNSHLVIDGTLFLQSNSPGGNISGMLYTNGTSNIIIEGQGTLNGNATGQIAGNLGHQCCIRTAGGSNILIRGITCINSSGSNLNIVGSSNVTIRDITQSGGVFASQFTGVSGGVAASNCWIYDSSLTCTTDFAWAFYDGASNCGIVNCKVNSQPVGVLTDGGALLCNNILISNNIFNVTGAAVQTDVANVAGQHTYITISDNQIIADRTVGNSQISIWFASHVSVTGNVISATAATHAGVAGIYVDNAVTDYLIANNIIRNCLNGIALYTATNGIIENNLISNSNNNGAAGTGIIVHSTCVNTIIRGNRIFDDQGSPTQVNGIADDGTSPGSGALIVGNIISNATTPYTIHPLSDTILVKYGTTTGVVDYTAANLRANAFGAYAEVTLLNAQNPLAATSTKIAFDTVSYDTASAWDGTNHRYTANVAGKYLVQVTCGMTATTATQGGAWKASVYKNGTEVAHTTLTAPNANSVVETMQCQFIVTLNGSTDYVEGWATVAGTVGMQFNPTASGVQVTYMTIQYLGS